MIEKTVLAEHFNCTKYASFIRQLNLYGFKKINSGHLDLRRYYHENFQKGKPELFHQMKRIKGVAPKINTQKDSRASPPEIETMDLQMINLRTLGTKIKILEHELRFACHTIQQLEHENRQLTAFIDRKRQKVQVGDRPRVSQPNYFEENLEMMTQAPSKVSRNLNMEFDGSMYPQFASESSSLVKEDQWDEFMYEGWRSRNSAFNVPRENNIYFSEPRKIQKQELTSSANQVDFGEQVSVKNNMMGASIQVPDEFNLAIRHY